ncbi:hypothetical protein AMQ84_11175 [Paenibacillus riograndensis]|uniref:Uncharacterized protein n=1 Tax=Paenibacillus riograndensis TaxID=483937 RepID=A0A132U2J8_9BACL|nr:hypothetical protein [Paenibacillus riograndensis]KWX77799.1 hypothetical protein AMQ84_11175 [Paenibacillus riograndensis]
MQRCLYRGECREGGVPESFFPSRLPQLNERMELLDVTRLSIFKGGKELFLYYECGGERHEPEKLLADNGELLQVWPGGEQPRWWVPMMDIFHYQQPVSREYWKRSQGERTPFGRVAVLKPEQVSSYVYYHYQYQEERPGDGDKYGIIGLHENLLFFYSELPATVEPVPYSGKLTTNLRPEHWGEVMEPHFIKWGDAQPDQEIWKKLTMVLNVAVPAGKKEE